MTYDSNSANRSGVAGTGGASASSMGSKSSMSCHMGSSYDRFDLDEEKNYWRENYRSRPYASRTAGYDVYEPAYCYGMDIYSRNPGRRFEDLDESELRGGWERFTDKVELTWERARDAARDAYNRLFDRDEKEETMRGRERMLETV